MQLFVLPLISPPHIFMHLDISSAWETEALGYDFTNYISLTKSEARGYNFTNYISLINGTRALSMTDYLGVAFCVRCQW